MATCPRCGKRFRFRNNDGTSVLEQNEAGAADAQTTPETPYAETAPERQSLTPERGAAPRAGNSAQADPVSAATPSRPNAHPEDDPLPPGAVTIPPPEDFLADKPGSPPSAGKKPSDTTAGTPDASEESGTATSGQAGRAAQPAEKRGDGSSFMETLQQAARKAREKGRQSLPGRSATPEKTGGEADALDVPWEHPERYNLWSALYQTIIRVMFNAPLFFKSLPGEKGKLSRPLIFYILLGVFYVLLDRMWLLMSLEAGAPSVTDPKMQEVLGALTQGVSLPLILLLSPVMLAIQLFFFSGIFFLMLRLVQPDAAPFPVIFRVVAYSAAPTIVCVVPLVGPMVGSLWFAVCCLIGCKQALNLRWSRILLALGPLYAIAFAVQLQVLLQHLGG